MFFFPRTWEALSGDGVVASCQPTALLLGRPRLRAAEAPNCEEPGVLFVFLFEVMQKLPLFNRLSSLGCLD